MSPVIHSGASDTWRPSGATFVTPGAWTGSLLLKSNGDRRSVLSPDGDRVLRLHFDG